MHHDALELPGGRTVLLTRLSEGRRYRSCGFLLPPSGLLQPDDEELPRGVRPVDATTLGELVDLLDQCHLHSDSQNCGGGLRS
jgi:hypothetical protein